MRGSDGRPTGEESSRPGQVDRIARIEAVRQAAADVELGIDEKRCGDRRREDSDPTLAYRACSTSMPSIFASRTIKSSIREL